jgi:RNA polymerase primary sigma factor
MTNLIEMEQTDLAVLAQNGNQAAKSLLVKYNERFVAGIARQYQGQGMDLSDLIQEGFIGLLRAIERYDIKIGTKFLTYASWWIKQSILQSLAEHNRHVRLPANRVNILEQVKKAKSQLSQTLQREPTEQEVLEHMDIEIADVFQQHSVSYDIPISSSEKITLLDVLENQESPSPDSALMKEAFTQELQMVLKLLNAREQKILKMLYGIDHERSYTLEEVGETLNLTRERVRQIKMRALKNLKRLNRRKKLNGLKN